MALLLLERQLGGGISLEILLNVFTQFSSRFTGVQLTCHKVQNVCENLNLTHIQVMLLWYLLMRFGQSDEMGGSTMAV